MNPGKSISIPGDRGQKSPRLETFHGKPHIHSLERYIKEDFTVWAEGRGAAHACFNPVSCLIRKVGTWGWGKGVGNMIPSGLVGVEDREQQGDREPVMSVY